MNKVSAFPDININFPLEAEGKSIEIGLSGGLDSVVLLHLLLPFYRSGRCHLSAVHVHHGLSQHADEWQQFCHNLCRLNDIPLRCVRVSINKNGKGIEAAAREARYRAFSDGISDIVALAHHRNDQIETFLLGMARGGGIRALAAMPLYRQLNSHTLLWRPLLASSRSDLENYARAYGLQYITDESNSDTTFLRNWFRHEMLPRMEQRIPHIGNHIVSNIASLQQDLAVLEEVLQEDSAWIQHEGYFNTARWQQFSPPRRRLLLKHFLSQHKLNTPPLMLEDMIKVLQTGRSGEWTYGVVKICFYRDMLFAVNTEQLHTLPWMLQPITGRLKDILLHSGFILKPAAYGLSEAILSTQGSIRKSDSATKMTYGAGHRLLKKLMQEYHIPPVLRPFWPVVESADGECLALANLLSAAPFSQAGGLLPVYPPFTQYTATHHSSPDINF